jgi:hypothetical protein
MKGILKKCHAHCIIFKNDKEEIIFYGNVVQINITNDIMMNDIINKFNINTEVGGLRSIEFTSYSIMQKYNKLKYVDTCRSKDKIVINLYDFKTLLDICKQIL